MHLSSSCLTVRSKNISREITRYIDNCSVLDEPPTNILKQGKNFYQALGVRHLIITQLIGDGPHTAAATRVKRLFK